MTKTLRVLRVPLILLLALGLATPTLAAPQAGSKPNIVLVLMDNFGYGEIGVYAITLWEKYS